VEPGIKEERAEGDDGAQDVEQRHDSVTGCVEKDRGHASDTTRRSIPGGDAHPIETWAWVG